MITSFDQYDLDYFTLPIAARRTQRFVLLVCRLRTPRDQFD